MSAIKKAILVMLLPIAMGSEQGSALGLGLWGRVTPFSEGEIWGSYGFLFKDHYTLGMTATQDGNALELGLAYELSRLGMTSNMAHLSVGHIEHIVHADAPGLTMFNGRYCTLSFNYALLFFGARWVERDIDQDLKHKSGRMIKRSVSDFFLGLGVFFNPAPDKPRFVIPSTCCELPTGNPSD